MGEVITGLPVIDYDGVRGRLHAEGFSFELTRSNVRYVGNRFNGLGKGPLALIFGAGKYAVTKLDVLCGKHSSRTFDTHYFERLGPAQCYVLGLLITDGCVYKDQLSFVSTDIELVSIVQREFLAFHKVRVSRTTSGKQAYTISFGSRDFVGKLSEFGLVPRKSKIVRVPQGLPYFWHFLRGVIDGDGSVLKDKRATHSGGLSVKIASGSIEFLQDLRKITGGCIYWPKVGGCGTLALCKSKAMDLFPLVYDGSEGLRLTRKHKKWLAALVPMYHGTGSYERRKRG